MTTLMAPPPPPSSNLAMSSTSRSPPSTRSQTEQDSNHDSSETPVATPFPNHDSSETPVAHQSPNHDSSETSVAPQSPNHDSSETSVATPSSSSTQNSSSSPPQATPEPDDKQEIDRSIFHVREEVPQEKLQRASVPYRIPGWSEPPCCPFYLEVLKEGSIIDQLNICEKGAYMFGRADLCDFVLEHPTISRFHAVIQFRKSGDAYMYDLGSTHGTFVNKLEIKKRDYVELHVGNIIRFGLSSRLYIFQGPTDLMQPEGDLNRIRSAKARQGLEDREASLARARREASLVDGISWGMQEDAIVEDEDITSEITWQTYKGQLTEKQEKTREKVLKRYEKIANMKKEIDAIRAKDIAQGGLTQGQQTQIARNEQRISEIMEELENLEETLNDSIQESVGARLGKTSCTKKAGPAEDEKEFLSDDDDFYDRTKKLSVRKNDVNQSIETSATLLDKQDAIMKEMEEKRQLLSVEKRRVESEAGKKSEADALDVYMSAVSSQLELDKTTRIENELSTLQIELDRIVYLLKFADPTGEAAKKKTLAVKDFSVLSPAQDSQLERPESHSSHSNVKKSSEAQEKDKTRNSEMKPDDPKKRIQATTSEPQANQVVEKVATVEKGTIYTVPKPQWLGAIVSNGTEEPLSKQEPSSQIEPDNFVGYKDRKSLVEFDKSQQMADATLENAAPGLIIRKKMPVEENNRMVPGDSVLSEAQTSAEDAIALLLKHKRGLYGLDDGDGLDESAAAVGFPSDKKAKKVHGPARPSFMEVKPEYESWVPPKGQTGDGRTSLNERYGY